jgi:hypothetical protein
MNTETKAIIKSSLISGIVYAALMAGYYYLDGQDLSIGRFLFNTLFFGIFLGLMVLYNSKKHKKKLKTLDTSSR